MHGITLVNPTKRRKTRKTKMKRATNGRFTKKPRRKNPSTTKAVVRRPKRRVKRKLTVARRRNPVKAIARVSRRRRRRNPVNLRGLKRFVTKDTGLLAAGVVGSFTLSQFVMGKYAANLPGLYKDDGTVSLVARTAYGFGIPMAGAVGLHYFKQPKISQGFAVGALVNLLNEALQYWLNPGTGATAGASAYLDPADNGAGVPGYQATNAFNEYLDAPGTQGMAAPSDDIYASQSAFGGSAW